MKLIWQKKEADVSKVETLKEQLNLSVLSATLMVNRGIDNEEKAKDFFNSNWEKKHHPFLMADLEKAAERIVRAIEEKEKILVYGDYDVDGTTSVALVYSFLKNELKHEFLDFYVPDRFSEGYGISTQSIEWASKNGIKLMIALDCGVKAHHPIQLANDLNIEVIVCDHHLPGEQLPDAYAVLDPKRTDCHYPFKELSGCGVGFKLLHGVCIKKGLSEDILKDYLDLVCISTCADIVPIIGENRIFVTEGLPKIQQSKRTGIQALLKTAGLHNKDLDVTKVVFGIAPRINAAGRIFHASKSVELLIEEDPQKAEELSKAVNELNTDRKTFDESITEEALTLIKENPNWEKTFSTVLFKPDWNKGVIGIVASRCIEQHYRPTIILTESNGIATGSARSVEGFDLYQAIESCHEHLIQFGGHFHAAGLTMHLDKINDFRESFEQFSKKFWNGKHPIPTLKYDAEVELNQLSQNFFKLLKRFAPFGPANEEPLLVTHHLELVGEVSILKEKHLKFKIKEQQSDLVLNAIAFGLVDKIETVKKGNFSLCYHLQENNFNNQTSIQLMVKDIENGIE
ncbi:MAG: single-stranded-DNA-specific exonuclease RecJ [Cytophagales bacterium]